MKAVHRNKEELQHKCQCAKRSVNKRLNENFSFMRSFLSRDCWHLLVNWLELVNRHASPQTVWVWSASPQVRMNKKRFQCDRCSISYPTINSLHIPNFYSSSFCSFYSRHPSSFEDTRQYHPRPTDRRNFLSATLALRFHVDNLIMSCN